ncbi:MAG: 1-hydroxycarotenoid 3,4-desaturase CrtD [Bacteroidota bacterium]
MRLLCFVDMMTHKQKKAIVIGAGIGGIATAIRLQIQGWQVAIYEANDYPGGKLSELRFDGYRFDAGPSLFTLPQLVDELFELAGKKPTESFQYEALPVITRYFYPDNTIINAYRDPDEFAAEVAAKTDERRETVAKLLRKSETLYEITHHVFLERSLHRLATYLRWGTIKSILLLYKLDAFRTMEQANAQHFDDPRVAQLFNRYATYNGSDPHQAPATLNIIPHLEHNIGAFFPREGMFQITKSLVGLAKSLGVELYLGHAVERILVEGQTAKGIQVKGQNIAADLVVSDADIVPTYRRLMPEQAEPVRTLEQARSSSALIFYWGMNRSFEALDVHNIFFSADYQAEFQQIWQEQSLSHDPTVYLYVSSKRNPEDAPEGCENWFTMINVPANQGQDWDHLIQQARQDIINKLSEMLGVDVAAHIASERVLEPRTIESKTSSYQGALYGNSSNNKFAAFLRHPNFSSKIKGLYFCGGSVHPGGGIPLCLLSAKITADLVAQREMKPFSKPTSDSVANPV